MSTATLEQAQQQRVEQIESNRDLGVIKYKSKTKQADVIFEVEEGHHTLPDGQRLGPGQRFHPTMQQLTGGRGGRSTLVGKAREIGRSEYRSIENRPAQSTGADFREMELQALPMTQHAFALANSAKLSAEDFAGIDPASDQGYTKGQVEDLIAKRSS